MYKVREKKTYRTWLELTDEERDTLRYDSSVADCVNDDIRMDIEDLFNWKLKEADLPADLHKHWSLGHCQGDGCSVTGSVSLTPALLDRLAGSEDCQSIRWHLENGEGFLTYRIAHNTHHYVHANTMYVELEDTDIEDVLDDELEVLGNSLLCHIREVCRSIERAGYEDIEFRESDECIGALCADNGVLFDEFGRPFWGLEAELEEDTERFSNLEKVA